mmetsp:Transcript_4336/g.7613  ORF Transcript_4336/g.7613 Transcript_4336/m.7613 type:complete len:80 (+) Transcript_4336:1455-1694(+)
MYAQPCVHRWMHKRLKITKQQIHVSCMISLNSIHWITTSVKITTEHTSGPTKSADFYPWISVTSFSNEITCLPQSLTQW